MKNTHEKYRIADNYKTYPGPPLFKSVGFMKKNDLSLLSSSWSLSFMTNLFCLTNNWASSSFKSSVSGSTKSF